MKNSEIVSEGLKLQKISERLRRPDAFEFGALDEAWRWARELGDRVGEVALRDVMDSRLAEVKTHFIRGGAPYPSDLIPFFETVDLLDIRHAAVQQSRFAMRDRIDLELQGRQLVAGMEPGESVTHSHKTSDPLSGYTHSHPDGGALHLHRLGPDDTYVLPDPEEVSAGSDQPPAQGDWTPHDWVIEHISDGELVRLLQGAMAEDRSAVVGRIADEIRRRHG